VVLSAFTKEGTVLALKQAESLLERIMTMFVVQLDEKVSNHAYNLILDAYSRVSGLEDRSRRIGEVMLGMQRAADRHDNPALLPDKFSYAALLRTTIAESNLDFVSKVDALLRTMEESAHAPARPDLKTYSMVLDACGKSQDVDAPAYAEELFGRLKLRCAQGDGTLRPDTSIYTILMKIYSNAGDAVRSESLLAVMAKECAAGNSSCRPDEVAYRTAISAWGRSSLPESLTRAMRLFQDMKNEHDNGNIACRPTSKTILELMLVVSRSKEANKIKIGKSLLQSMRELGIPWDQRVWNAFLGVCAKTTVDATDRNEALQTAIEVFESLRNRESMVADSGIYSSMLYVGENLIENMEERHQFQCEVFSMCAEDGKVNRPVLLTLRRLLPAGRYQSLTGLDPKITALDMAAVPSSWQRHT
jgi:hypothetical protein